MKRTAAILCAVCAMLSCFILTGCVEEWKYKDMDAAAIAETMQSEGVPIAKITALTPDTDSNELMGKPNGYTSKCYCLDSSLEADYDEEILGNEFIVEDEGLTLDTIPYYGGTIEVYETEEGAEGRAKYLSAFNGTGMGAFGVNAWIYQDKNAVLRVSYDVAEDQAKLYEAAFLGKSSQ